MEMVIGGGEPEISGEFLSEHNEIWCMGADCYSIQIVKIVYVYDLNPEIKNPVLNKWSWKHGMSLPEGEIKGEGSSWVNVRTILLPVHGPVTYVDSVAQ